MLNNVYRVWNCISSKSNRLTLNGRALEILTRKWIFSDAWNQRYKMLNRRAVTLTKTITLLVLLRLVFDTQTQRLLDFLSSAPIWWIFPASCTNPELKDFATNYLLVHFLPYQHQVRLGHKISYENLSSSRSGRSSVCLLVKYPELSLVDLTWPDPTVWVRKQGN